MDRPAIIDLIAVAARRYHEDNAFTAHTDRVYREQAASIVDDLTQEGLDVVARVLTPAATPITTHAVDHVTYGTVFANGGGSFDVRVGIGDVSDYPPLGHQCIVSWDDPVSDLDIIRRALGSALTHTGAATVGDELHAALDAIDRLEAQT